MASYQWTTSNPYEGGAVLDLALTLAPGKVVAVVQVPRASLERHDWSHPSDHPSLTYVGLSALGAGSHPSVVSIAPADAAVAYRAIGSSGNPLAWLPFDAGPFTPASLASSAGGRASIAGFATTIDAPKASSPRSPAGRSPAVSVGPAGKRVVTAYNLTSKPDTMRLTFWNVPYQTITSLSEPVAYQFLVTSPARRPSVVGLRETVDGIALRSADALVASASATDHLQLGRYHLDPASPATISSVGHATTGDLVQEIAMLAVPVRRSFVVLTAVVTAGGQLKLIGWKVGASGPPVFWFEQIAGPAYRVQAVRIRSRDFATGIVDASGQAWTRYWRLPAADDPAPQCQPLATTGSVPNAKAIRLVHRPGPGKALGMTFVARQRQDDTFQLHAYRLTET